MTVDKGIKILSGTMVIISVLLGMNLSDAWFYLTLFIGFMLIQSAFTGFCPCGGLAKVLGAKEISCARNKTKSE
ncbi:DUF2892 domain-containing protein [Candidatus Thioglobus sp.]|jgi:hypothetical protein|uniref:YgaP family membrane protein n=1 Tax=Candidatus Thioglobus sp. TaxID=2026721 RepID=UPI001E16689A|nr:DUF2892 domain-containing protein [Candidatus Thioglobus sp.]MBT3276416.1 DUF2892 domain-containing protein [Candidatus Thioglobus sp.]MBT3446462.1 DUF2892 domain-containing protein [Candidatus Thioglobus sp.]MBT3744371.1 DUF2892 domain-containing protein [Candidatus Thioglobus sp.]MBT4000997.1 DUF2892 domain-containing protein [Candidatus Thioglobus sp.]MBT4315860.1 DUF2892 domain-containing protein [Candidatus Thioglobus sp.]